jgi:hypothetical protein
MNKMSGLNPEKPRVFTGIFVGAVDVESVGETSSLFVLAPRTAVGIGP